MPVNLENSVVATGQEKFSFHSKAKEGQGQRMFKLPFNCTHFACLCCSKSSNLGFSSMRTKNFQTYKLDLEKEEEPDIKLQTFVGS